MSLIAPEEIGYTGQVLKMASNGGKCAIYISPVQEELDTAPLPLNDETFKNTPKAVCHRCNDSIALQFITEHLKCCGADKIYEESNKNEISPSIAEQPCPLCKEVFPLMLLESHAATCGDPISAGNAVDECSTVIIDDQDPVPGPSGTSTSTGEWFTIQDCDEAISQFRFSQTQKHLLETPLCLSMDIRQSVAEQDMALILFYKRPNIQWARPLNCRLEGDVAVGEGVNRCIDRMKSGFNINFGNSEVTRVIDGEPGHLVPSASHFLIESDMFLMVGRMLGHSFIHGGPCLSGLSPAFIHVLLGGTPETATVTLEDWPDWDIRETIRLLEGDAEISEEDKQKVQELAAAWDLPPLNENNRRWMFEKLLMHAVTGRITRQTKQMRRGLKETGMWTVLTNKPDTLGLLFPTEGASHPVPEVLLRRITWPFNSGDDEDDDCCIDTKCRISGYVRQFIENATPDELKSLLRFWTGWEVMPTHVRVEVVGGNLFTACTCYETLRVPQHYNTYQAFQRDLLACIGTSHTGFGLI